MFKPVMPPPLLAHSYASASVVTDVLMKKYVDGMLFALVNLVQAARPSLAA